MAVVIGALISKRISDQTLGEQDLSPRVTLVFCHPGNISQYANPDRTALSFDTTSSTGLICLRRRCSSEQYPTIFDLHIPEKEPLTIDALRDAHKEATAFFDQ